MSDPSGSTKPTGKLTGWDWFNSIHAPRFVLSPMVGQSELAFRMLVRARLRRVAKQKKVPEQGTILAYTPMMISSRFAEDASYREQVFQTCPEDRPLVAQFCSTSPDDFVNAAKLVQDRVDAVDLNIGCPQEVAKRGGYGSWMMEKKELIKSIITKASKELNVPVTAKIRVHESFQETLQYVLMLQEAGVSLITVHGRMRHMREEVLSDLAAAHRLRPFLRIPIIVNGDIWAPEDLAICYSCYKIDGVMSAQGLLHNPALFEPFVGHPLMPPRPQCNDVPVDPKNKKKHPLMLERFAAQSAPKNFEFVAPGINTRYRLRRAVSPIMTYSISTIGKHPLSSQSNIPKIPAEHAAFVAEFEKPITTPEDAKLQFSVAKDYIQCVRRYPPPHNSIVRRHLFFMLFDNFQANLDVFDDLYVSETIDEWVQIIKTLENRAMSGKTCKNPDPISKVTGKPRPLRRDGTVGPPPWPVGGGGLNVAETGPLSNSKDEHTSNTKQNGKKNKKQQNYDEDDLEVVSTNPDRKKQKKGGSKNNNTQQQQKAKLVSSVVAKQDMSRFD